MNNEEVLKFLERGVIPPSNSRWAAQVLCLRKKGGILRLCVYWRKLNSLLVLYSGGLGDIAP